MVKVLRPVEAHSHSFKFWIGRFSTEQIALSPHYQMAPVCGAARGGAIMLGSNALVCANRWLLLNPSLTLRSPQTRHQYSSNININFIIRSHPSALHSGRRCLCTSQANEASSGGATISTNTYMEEGEVSITGKKSGRSTVSASPLNHGEVIDVNPPRGTRDFLPEDMRLRNWLFQKFREVSRLFAFEEVDYPVLESEALFVRKSGEEITEQLYSFEDKGGRRVALRPELTPSLARVAMQKGKALSLPLKWFVIGQCWRYERMTRGRRREHYQWNMDIMGISGIEAEAELLSAIVTFFKQLGITSSDVGIKVSSRKVLEAVMEHHSIPKDSFSAVCVMVDKIEKMPAEDMKKELRVAGISSDAVEGILHALSLRSLSELEELLGSDSGAVAELKRLFSFANKYGYADWLQFDASVVRGLAYYTGTVFEGFDKDRKLRAICGGGRYDRLLSTFGGTDIPACGFGFGDAVIVELLREKKLIPNLIQEIDDIVFPLNGELKQVAAMVASNLRNSGRIVDLILEDRRLKWAFKHAERVNAKRLFLVGDAEWERGAVRVKDLATREESDMLINDLL